MTKMGRRTHVRRAVARKEAKSKRKVAREKPEHVGRVARQDTLQRGVEKVATKKLYAIDDDDSEDVDEATANEEDLPT